MPPARSCPTPTRTAWLAAWLVTLGSASYAGVDSAGTQAVIPARGFQSRASIEDLVRGYLLEQLPQAQRAEAGVDVGYIDARLQLPTCGAALTVIAGDGRPAAGAVTVGVRCRGERPWTLYVPARVNVRGPVVVLARPVARGAPIQAEDIEIVRRDLAGLSHGYAAAGDAVIGRVARQSLAAGQVLQTSQILPPRLIRRGEQVTLRVTTAGFEVSVAGSALADGVLGQRIRVRNERSQKVVEGEVVAAGAVRVSI